MLGARLAGWVGIWVLRGHSEARLRNFRDDKPARVGEVLMKHLWVAVTNVHHPVRGCHPAWSAKPSERGQRKTSSLLRNYERTHDSRRMVTRWFRHSARREGNGHYRQSCGHYLGLPATSTETKCEGYRNIHKPQYLGVWPVAF